MLEQPDSKKRERIQLALLLIVGLMRFVNLGFLDLQAWDEALYAVRAEGILLFGGFLDQTPFSIGGLYSSLHPPLYVWLTSLSFAILGVTEFAARSASALFGVFTIFVVYQLGKELKDSSVGFVAALLFGLNPFVTFLARQGQFDTTMVFFLSLAVLSYLRTEREGRSMPALVAGLAVGGALMTKLFVGFGIPLTIVLWHISNPERRDSAWKPFFLSIAAMAIVAVPWHFYMTLVRGFGNPLFILDASAVLERSLYGVEGNVKSLEWFYFVNQLLVLFPLGLFWFLLGIFEIFKNRDRRWMLPALWFVVFFVVFSLMRTKLSVYVLPMLVPASIIGAKTIVDFSRDRGSARMAAALLGGTGLAYLWSSNQDWRNSSKAMLSDLLRVQVPETSTLLSIAPFVFLFLLVIALCVLLYRYDLMIRVRPFLPIVLIAPSFLMSFYNIIGHDRHQYKDGAAELAAFIERKQPAGIVVIGFDRNPQLTFYLEGADIGWRNDMEVRRISPPAHRSQLRNWLSEQISDLPSETLVIVEKDKIVRYEWVTAEEATPIDYVMVFDSRRYVVYQRPMSSQLALVSPPRIPSPTSGFGAE
jgi:4-amino-4-deoxy-L-arabinose transferase-like glycosyltransferase